MYQGDGHPGDAMLLHERRDLVLEAGLQVGEGLRPGHTGQQEMRDHGAHHQNGKEQDQAEHGEKRSPHVDPSPEIVVIPAFLGSRLADHKGPRRTLENLSDWDRLCGDPYRLTSAPPPIHAVPRAGGRLWLTRCPGSGHRVVRTI